MVKNIPTEKLKRMTDTINTKKQDTLVSGTNIKTINGESILGSGNITIQGGSGSGLTTDEVNTLIESKGYTTIQDVRGDVDSEEEGSLGSVFTELFDALPEIVNDAIGEGLDVSSAVSTEINNRQLQTSNDVQNAISSATSNFVTPQQVEDTIASKGFLTDGSAINAETVDNLHLARLSTVQEHTDMVNNGTVDWSTVYFSTGD